LKNDVIVPSKSNKQKNFLKVNDENSMDPRIRIRTKMSRIRNTARSLDQKGHRIPDSQHWKNKKGNACLDSSRHRRRPDRLHTAAEDRMGSGPCHARPAAPCTRQHHVSEKKTVQNYSKNERVALQILNLETSLTMI
jgi:hypothetical protein